MARDTITLRLDGDIPIEEYAKAIGHFSALLRALSDEVSASAPIEWDIAQLSSGSAVATVRGTSLDPVAIEKVVIGYGIVGRSLEEGKPIPYSEDVAEPAIRLTSLLNGHIKAVQLITDDYTASVTEPVTPETEKQSRHTALGVVTGHVYAIWHEPRVRFALYDNLFGRRVTCYLDAGEQERAREVWGTDVSVMGMVYRDPETGRPVDVTNIVNITPAEQKQPGAFLRAAGALPWQEGDEPSETIIRRLRDAG